MIRGFAPPPSFATEADRQAMQTALVPLAGHLCFFPTRDGRMQSHQIRDPDDAESLRRGNADCDKLWPAQR